MASELLNVSQVFAGTEDKPILHGVDLSVGEGECHVLMGPNGAGVVPLLVAPFLADTFGMQAVLFGASLATVAIALAFWALSRRR